MELEKIIAERRTVHRFKKESVSKEVLMRALDLARFAPNHKLSFPWRFTVSGESLRQKLAGFAVQKKSQECGGISEQAQQKIEEKFLNPAYLVVASYLRSADSVRDKEDYAAACCAIQNLMLVLCNHGVATKWSTTKISQLPETYDLLKIDSSLEEIIGFIWVGMAQNIPAPPKRPELEHFVRELS